MSSVQNQSRPAQRDSFLVRPSSSSRQELPGGAKGNGYTDGAAQPRATNLSNSGLRWGDNIWGNSAFSNGLGSNSTSREGLSSRDGSIKPLASEAIEGKTGSGALVESSVSDGWGFARSSSIPSSSKPADTSFSQRQPTSNASLGQAYGGAPRHSSTSTYSSLHAPVNLNTASAGTKAPFTSAFEMPATCMNNEQPPQVYTKFNQASAVRATDSAWGDGNMMHSPVDERKSSVAGTGMFGLPSQSSSRNNSLPPSRHSDVPPQYPVTYPDSHTVNNTLRNNSVSGPSRANGVVAPRFDSPMNQMVTQFGQTNMNGETLAHSSHRPSVSGFLNQSSPYSTSPTLTRGLTFGSSGMQYDSEDTEEIPRHQYSTDAFSSQTMPDLASHQVPQYETRTYSNNNNNNVAVQYPRQPAHYPGSAASQRSYEHVNGSQMINSYSNNSTMNAPHNHAAALEQKLRSLPVQFQDQQFASHDSRQLAVARASPRDFYSQYGFPQGVPVYNMPIHPSFNGFSMGMMPVMDMSLISRAPRDQFEAGENVRSQLLEDFKQNAKTANKHYELKDIYDHIVEFSGDQHGSRFIQQKLESANSDEKERVFRELQSNALQLMTDVFGNYVIQKFFEHGDQTQKKVLANKMKGQVRQLSLQMYGCRVVQKALDHILNDQQASLIRELKDDVIRCVKDQNGNHVIQKAIERCEAKDIDFIFSAFTNQIHTLSIHTYGCRVIQRCLEHCELPTRQAILRELQDSMPNLIGDGFGNYVVQHVVEHGGEADKQKVLDMVIKGLEGFSKHKFASNVVEQCLTHATDAWRKEVLEIIVRGNRREGEGMLIGFIRDNYGNYVIQKLLDVLCYQDYMNFMSLLQPEMAKAKRTGCGKQVMAIEKKMHRFATHPQYGSIHANNFVHARSSATISETTTPPPLTADCRSVQTSSVASVNGDAIEGAPINRKGSIQSSEPTVFECIQ